MEATSPDWGCEGREGQGRGIARYRGRRRSLLPPPPRSSCSSARAAGARARPRLRPRFAPRGLLGTVVLPGRCYVCSFQVTWGEGWQKKNRRGREGVCAPVCQPSPLRLGYKRALASSRPAQSQHPSFSFHSQVF